MIQAYDHVTYLLVILQNMLSWGMFSFEDVGTIYEKFAKTLVICQTEPNTPSLLHWPIFNLNKICHMC